MDQVCWRITKDKNGKILYEDDYSGKIIPLQKELKEAQQLITEFWYKDTPHTVEVYGIQQESPHLKVPGLAIADSGCRNSVGGIQWHYVMQEKLKELGVPWMEVEEKETYKFGAGAPIISKKACIYPVRIHGQWDLLRMSVVDQDASTCPGLVGPSDLSRWQAVFRFGQKEIELNGTSKTMVLTWTRHPGIQLVEYSPNEVEEALKYWRSEEAQEKKTILVECPQSLSFVAQHEEDESSEENEGQEGSEEDDQEHREKRKAQWMHHLQQDLGMQVQGDETVPEEELVTESGEGESGEDSSTSHEVGVEVVSSGSEDDEEAEQEAEKRGNDTFITYGQKRPMNKHLRRRLAAQANGIADSYAEEKGADPKRQRRQEHVQDPREAAKGARKTKWSVLEVFTWTCAISIMASA